MEEGWRVSYLYVLVRCSLVIIRIIFCVRSRLGRIYLYLLWLNLKQMLGSKLGNLTHTILCGIDPTHCRYYLLRPCSLAFKNGFLVCNCTKFGTKTYIILHSRKRPTSFWHRCWGIGVASLIFLLWFNAWVFEFDLCKYVNMYSM